MAPVGGGRGLDVLPCPRAWRASGRRCRRRTSASWAGAAAAERSARHEPAQRRRARPHGVVSSVESARGRIGRGGRATASGVGRWWRASAGDVDRLASIARRSRSGRSPGGGRRAGALPSRAIAPIEPTRRRRNSLASAMVRRRGRADKTVADDARRPASARPDAERCLVAALTRVHSCTAPSETASDGVAGLAGPSGDGIDVAVEKTWRRPDAILSGGRASRPVATGASRRRSGPGGEKIHLRWSARPR